MRLNRYIAQSTSFTRREADTLIREGRVLVNGTMVKDLGTQVDPETDRVLLDGEPVEGGALFYILFNRPVGFLPDTTLLAHHLPHDRANWEDLPLSLSEEDCGLELMSNDSDLIQGLLRSTKASSFLYHIFFDEPVTADSVSLIAAQKGVQTAVLIEGSNGRQLGLSCGMQQGGEVRELLSDLHCNILKLDRVMIYGLTKKNLPRGKSRELSRKELSFLKMA
ncbi:MAG: hypothetical protein HKN79_12410 [Flavobacteriales bacterium]|nr:hypothetical protein [Flavobacteriales bacterium]